MKETVRYEALVSQVELRTEDELTHGSVRRLSYRGWGLLVNTDVDHVLAMGFEPPQTWNMEGGAPSWDSLPSNVNPDLGQGLESIRVLVTGRLVELGRAALQNLQFGKRIEFLEIFCGMVMLTLGVKARGMKARDGWDSIFDGQQ